MLNLLCLIFIVSLLCASLFFAGATVGYEAGCKEMLDTLDDYFEHGFDFKRKDK